MGGTRKIPKKIKQVTIPICIIKSTCANPIPSNFALRVVSQDGNKSKKRRHAVFSWTWKKNRGKQKEEKKTGQKRNVETKLEYANTRRLISGLARAIRSFVNLLRGDKLDRPTKGKFFRWNRFVAYRLLHFKWKITGRSFRITRVGDFKRSPWVLVN